MLLNSLIGLGFFFLLGLGTPLYVVIVLLSVLLFISGDIPLAATVISFKRLEVQEFLSAIPLFTYAGYALSHSDIPKRIVAVSEKWLGWFTGSSTAITVLVMAFFTALTGASGISILALGALMYPLLMRTSKNEKFSYGLIAGSGSIGLLIAPSLPVIIYGIISNQNSSGYYKIDIDALFKAALLPSVLLIGLYILYGIFIERRGLKRAATPKSNTSHTPSFNLKAALHALKEAGWEIPLPLLVYGGIYWGILTVLEASLVAFLYTVVLLFFIRREFTFRKDFIPLTVAAMKLSGGIFIIMASAFILTNYLVNERIPDQIFAALSPYLTNPYVFLIAINVFLLLAGCVLDIFSAILIILPLVLPIVERYGIHPYHFAIVFLVNLEIGYLTPPVGLNLFIASYRFKKDIVFIYKAAIPFLILLLSSLMLLTYIPKLSTFTLPSDNATTSSAFSKNNEETAGSGTTIDREAPTSVRELRVASQSPTSLTLSFIPAVDSGASVSTPEAINYKVLYIDEHLEELELISDLGEEQIFLGTEATPENTSTKNRVELTLAELLPATSYSLIVIAVDTAGNESFPSDILLTETK